MTSAIADFLVALTYPPFLSLLLALCGAVALLLLRWRRLAKALMLLAFGWSLLWSLPQCSNWLRASLARQYPQVEETSLPQADAIVVLGGGRYAWLHRPDVGLEDLDNSRIATGTRAWLAGRAPLVILSGGGSGNGRSEADVMAKAITRLGVPASALILEERSRSTRDNAMFTARLARERGIGRVLLVTSAVHMPRAAFWFREAGLDVMPVPVPERSGRSGWKRWIPSHRALWRSGRAWKEYAGLLAAHIETMGGQTAGVDSSK